MFNTLSVRILAPIIFLMISLGASIYFVVLQTVNEFAQNNIEKDLSNFSHELFDVVDRGFMEVVKGVKNDDQIAVRLKQVDCLDILERSAYSRHFELIIFEKQTDKILLQSDLPGHPDVSNIIQRFQTKKDDSLLQIAGDEFYVRQFHFSPWDWSFLVLKNKNAYTELSRKVELVYGSSAIVLVLVTIVLIAYLRRSIKNPITAIISSIRQGESPNYCGIHEFEFLSKSISEMRSSLKNNEEERVQFQKELQEAYFLAESESMKVKAMHQDKLASLGLLATGVAHEINQPLSFIKIIFECAIRDINQNTLDKKELTNECSEALQQIKRITLIVNHLRSFGREDSFEALNTKIHEVLDNTLILMQKGIQLKNINFLQDVPKSLPPVLGNSIKLEQVFINLIQNSVDSLEGQVGAEIQVSAYQENDTVKVRFCDNGEGIPENIQDKIFDPFFTTKEVGKGTGLGLSIIYSIIKDHDGNIEYLSRETGACFLITLPARITA